MPIACSNFYGTFRRVTDDIGLEPVVCIGNTLPPDAAYRFAIDEPMKASPSSWFVRWTDWRLAD